MFLRKIYLYLTLVPLLVLVQPACKKYEQVPLDIVDEYLVYDQMDKNGFYAEEILNNLYTYLPMGFNRLSNSFLDAATDDAIPSQSSNAIQILSNGRQSSTQDIDQVWERNYAGIRKATLFLSKVDRVPVNIQTLIYWKAEARFIRTILYFELVKRYGGVPLLGNIILTLTDDLNVQRNSYNECIQYIENECDTIQLLLRKEPVSDVDLGRITQGAALALKSRLLLYAASPLNNIANDIAKWQKAFDAAKKVIDLNIYSLNPSFITLFTTRKNPEIILAYQRVQSQDVEKNNAPTGFSGLNNSSGLTSPTQELVDAFVMNNGKPITDPTSGYTATNPYVNRDPRFNATIFYNGSKWLGRDVETFDGGKDRPVSNSTQTTTKTGYYLRKFMADYSTGANYSNQDHNFIIFRYAEILLNYAEAANEIGQTSIALDQLKTIRKRAGITAGTGSLYGLKANMSQAEMREAVQLERRLEMAFEEQRYWDVRRWKQAEQTFNKTLHGVQIIKTATSTYTYTTRDVAQITFIAPKMYLYPLPYSEILANTALTQNPGW